MTARDGLRSLIYVESMARDVRDCRRRLRWTASSFWSSPSTRPRARPWPDVVRSLGFRHAGRHRSKAVDFYRQGRTNLVLNQEQDSTASEHFQLHGPSVCATALRVDDADRVVSRAKALTLPRLAGAGSRGRATYPGGTRP